MGNQTQSVSVDELQDLMRQCAALHQDWQRFHQLATVSNGSAPGGALDFIQLQSRLSCDYPILSHWRKANLGLAAGISKLVAHAGTLEAFAREAQSGNGPLLREWQTVDGSIAKVRGLLESALRDARAGKPVRLPKEIAAPKVAREPWPIQRLLKGTGIAAATLVGIIVVLAVFRPFLMQTRFFRWLDDGFRSWQVRNHPEFGLKED